MPLIAIPVVHAAGGYIASTAAAGYVAGTLSATWTGAFIAGNTLLVTSTATVATTVAGASAYFAGLF